MFCILVPIGIDTHVQVFNPSKNLETSNTSWKKSFKIMIPIALLYKFGNKLLFRAFTFVT